jgi:hypothetical protein
LKLQSVKSGRGRSKPTVGWGAPRPVRPMTRGTCSAIHRVARVEHRGRLCRGGAAAGKEEDERGC